MDRHRSGERRSRRRGPVATAIVLATACVLTSCGGSDASSAAPDDAASTTATPKAADAALTTETRAILDASLQPGAINWNCCGADAPATGAMAAVRVPGHEDLLVAAGTEVDGSPYDPALPIRTGTLMSSVVQTLVFQLIDEGELDADATVDTWLPGFPNADRVTVGMLVDGSHGWGGFGAIGEQQVTADFERTWTLAEVLDTVEGVPPVGDPGTFDPGGSDIALTALAFVMEQVTGSSFPELMETRITGPAGLTALQILDGTAPYGHDGVFVLGDQVRRSSEFPSAVAYYSYYQAVRALGSTGEGLLDLLDVWRRGDLFDPPRVPEADHFPPERLEQGAPVETDGSTIIGEDVPFNGYCPCEPNGGGLEVSSFGRGPDDLGSRVYLVAYDDGISVVVQWNSRESGDMDIVRKVVDDIHAAAAAATA